MDEQRLRRADFKTGIGLVMLCLWLLSVTFAFMPFRETYGGVENAWYVSPWIFPAVVLVLLLVVSVVLTANAVRCRGHLDVLRFEAGVRGAFRLTVAGRAMMILLVLASAAGITYLAFGIEEKIRLSAEEAKWLADPSKAEVFGWDSPLALVPLAIVATVFVLACAALAAGWGDASKMPRTAAAGGREGQARVGVITLLFSVLVYVLVPRVDFFIGALLFLYAFTVSFHVARLAAQRVALALVMVIALVAVFTGVFGDDVAGGAAAAYGLDVVCGLCVIGVMTLNARLCRGDPALRRAHRHCLLIAWLTPLLLVPAFRFGLLVPMPHEGVVIEAMHQVRYGLR